MNTQTESIQDRIKALVLEGTMPRAAIARAAGLHANSLRDCTAPTWNPTSDTLAKLAAFLDKRNDRPILSSPEEIIDEARNGRMFILVDDEDRENEGDLIIPAQMATPAAINFMATHGRGLICLAMTKDRVDQLGLELMSRNNRTRHETAFTTSIEAREGVTTGISAADRSRTITVAIDSSRGADDIVTPGHVFPLVARNGGVLVRAGHTEAAVDISRLAGLNPSGVICEIMKDDGTMARMDDLIEFARKHDLKIGTIRDLIAYRRQNDHLVEQRGETRIKSMHGGSWTVYAFYNKATGDETLAMTLGHIDPDKPTLVRMHALNFLDEVLAEEVERSGQLARSMKMIADEGAGVVVIINRYRRRIWSTLLQAHSGKIAPPEMDELRDYGAGAQILTELGVHQMILLTNSHHSLVALEGYGLSIVGERPIEG
ncbi:3,4-dihydroxy-2-butanone-4-phosphate synthase [Croceicoccus naphthovorans]|uniref:3,4-dihydroxy-2-butanone 4-phosphate synthase n=1 Tax=Croceicoccus naphthovorans TaxID=1348774 RepID=A0A0G3XMD9_9SPHN|nr:3,4-dihydroxy-2-butanone-4-phosphate synthase [Croceicoccus naphthovorans]AKM11618.1 3,4-dihydroxy-2-butanone 4-phosphate synthase [Croceicoccus naphthovorans]MBB3990654.1 3,4-dihydroxy 2-butanone 4-phosphate synthase/GTP cyclohydrolase II [Croceicoccus naphthovorans]